MLELVDRALQWLVRHQINNVPVPVHPLMAAGYPSLFADEGYEAWLPIASTVTTRQLAELEATLGYSLPASYKAFLQHKHFYELTIGQAEFFAHPPDEWLQVLREEMLQSGPAALDQTGLLPFASWGGAGDELCFDTTQPKPAAEYPVMLWHHEDGRTKLFSANFAALWPQLLAETPERAI